MNITRTIVQMMVEDKDFEIERSVANNYEHIVIKCGMFERNRLLLEVSKSGTNFKGSFTINKVQYELNNPEELFQYVAEVTQVHVPPNESTLISLFKGE